MILDKYQLIFFHVPKVAGTSIEKTLCPAMHTLDYREYNSEYAFGIKDGYMMQHADYSLLSKYVEESKMQRYFKFAFFRNTWERLFSAYRYLKPHYDRQFGDFEGYLSNACDLVDAGTYDKTGHIKPQIDYVLHNDIPILDFEGRYEDLQKGFNEVCSITGIPHIKLPTLNKNDKWELYKNVYTPEMIERVARSYAYEIDYFKFVF